VLPPAPAAERGLVCRPRQVRSGVPRALDALCDRVLNGSHHGSGHGAGPGAVESAAQVSEALSVWLGEPVAGTAVASAGLLLGDDLHPWQTDTDTQTGNGSGPHPDPDATVAARLTVPDGSEDPDGTQAWQPPGRVAGEDTGAQPGERPRTSGSGSRSAAAHATATRTVTAPARSDVPTHWGPDRPDEPPASPPEPPQGGVPWLRLAAVLAALTLAVLAVVVAFDLGSTPSGAPDDGPTSSAQSPSATPSRPVPVTVTSFDPDDQSGGPPVENPDQVSLVTDGDPTTAWTTETYQDGPPLAPYKRGLGLLLDLGRERPVSSVDITLDGGDHDLTLFAAPGASAAPTDITGLTRVAREAGVQGRVRVRPTDLTTRWLVVWLTALPVSGPGYQGQVGEVVVRS
jgi:hypothetical protein